MTAPTLADALPPMTDRRAVYFMERFKREEKMLGPNEQAALDYVITLLEARAALAAADAAMPEPDMRHPKIQALIGSNARRNIELSLVEQLIDNPDCELSSTDMEYWNGMHDRLRDALMKAAMPERGEAVPLAKIVDGLLHWHVGSATYALPQRYMHGTHLLYTHPYPAPAAQPVQAVPDRDKWQAAVFTLMGHASGLYAEGKQDMPAWCYELAEKIARTHLDEASAQRVRQVAEKERAHHITGGPEHG